MLPDSWVAPGWVELEQETWLVCHSLGKICRICAWVQKLWEQEVPATVNTDAVSEEEEWELQGSARCLNSCHYRAEFYKQKNNFCAACQGLKRSPSVPLARAYLQRRAHCSAPPCREASSPSHSPSESTAMHAGLERARLWHLQWVVWQCRTPLNICKVPFIYVEHHTFLPHENTFPKVWQLRNLKQSRELWGVGRRLLGQAERAQYSWKLATESRGLCPMPRSCAQHTAIITASFKRKSLSTAQFTPLPFQ